MHSSTLAAHCSIHWQTHATIAGQLQLGVSPRYRCVIYVFLLPLRHGGQIGDSFASVANLIQSSNSASSNVSCARSFANVYNAENWSVTSPEDWLVNPKQIWNPTYELIETSHKKKIALCGVLQVNMDYVVPSIALLLRACFPRFVFFRFPFQNQALKK